MDSSDELDRDVVSQRLCTLENLVKTLEVAYKQLEKYKDRSLILCFGTTGCGKSTMLNSVLFGSTSLQQTKLEENMNKPDGEKKKNMRTVIDVKEGADSHFKIGHSRVTSQTFIPDFIEDPDPNQPAVWVDIAGFGDTSGELIEYINTFIDKKIFNVAKDVKVIMPFTVSQIGENRGGLAAELLKLMQNIFQNYMGQKEFAIMPVLTQVDPTDEDFDFDIVKDNFEKILKNELDKQFQGFQEGANDKDDDDVDEDMDFHTQNKEKVWAFFDYFIKNIKVFDPLDRDIMTPDEEGDEQVVSTKAADLKQIIYDMQAMECSEMNIPLDPYKFKDMMTWLDTEREQCQEKAEEIIRNAKAEGADYEVKFENEEIVQKFKRSMKFLIDHQVLEQIEDKYNDFVKFISEISEQTEKAKIYGQVTQIVKLSMDYAQDMVQRKVDGRWNQLVKKMIQIHDNIKELETYEQFESEDHKKEAKDTIAKMKQLIIDSCKEVCEDPQKLICFAYEVRKQDAEEQQKNEGREKDYFTKHFLKDIQMDAVMRTIIDSNYWTGETMQIEPQTLHYELRCGEEFKYELRCDASEGQKKPFIISSQVERYSNEENKEALVSLLTSLQVSFDKLKQKIKDHWGKGSVKIQFLLTQRGLRILHNNRSFICRNGPVAAGRQQALICGQQGTRFYDDDHATTFFLKPFSVHNTQQRYYIQMPFGERHPRLKSNKISPNLWSYLMVTVDKSDGYFSSEQTLWQIRQKYS